MTIDSHEARKAAVYEAALQLIAQGVSPAALKIQQLADAAGIGKGTVYEYFSSKDEILKGLAVYCFARENERIRELCAGCATLADFEEKTTAYLQDIAENRMASYKMIAQTLGAPNTCGGGIPVCGGELKEILRELITRLQAAGEIAPDVSAEYCGIAIFSAVVGGLVGMCYGAEYGTDDTLPQNVKLLLHRALKK